ncbi:hypothetical protein [Actinoplanes regularis]|uniref:Uncharacterized protein n=1 Tax=Actinoplanes regularis TaxID=52697 RepID=A0A239HE06_9ACTN|nr:hypothetical protein [Actinoplanes regularis]GIE91018.1 hypothetical protein Are01nite_74980 [Actinoplanes regularis]GLW34285.1 hypothetical protein Areg01_72220 [Actinoplanes regularis]SNS79649.1 hypothetical protein SAMN06264365_12457 [Actinoplanes regularis]
MSETPDANDDFIARYTTLMLAVWNDAETERRLVADPRAEALTAGLPVQPNAAVVLDRSQPDGVFSRETLVADWTADPGRHVLHVPAAPMIDLDELDERQLDLIAAGSSDTNVVIVLCVVA